MGFQKYIDDAWAKHAKETNVVVESYNTAMGFLQSEEDVLGLMRLISHIATDHNFNFDIAVNALEKLQAHTLAQAPSTQSHLKCQIATMRFISQPKEDVSHFSVSDRTMIFIAAASSCLFQKNFSKAEALLNNAIAASHSLKDAKDPAFRTLAMCTNNMASEISQRTVLNQQEKKFMMDLAHYARNFWEKAGTWLHVERAEYYLSKYYRKIGDLQSAENHAQLCLQICEKEKAEPLEHFFAHESLALAYREKKNDIQYQRHLQQMRNYFSQCKDADQSWMRESLNEAERR